MNYEEEQTIEGLNQIFEMINSKGDIGELKEIVEKSAATRDEDKQNHQA